MKKWVSICLACVLLGVSLLGGYAAEQTAPESVVTLLGSYAEAWILAGGTLIGTTEDAVSERNMDLGEDVHVIGTTKEPNLERIIDLEPDLVIYSLDIQNQVEMAANLEKMGIHCEGFSVTTYEEYLRMMQVMCDSTGREDLYNAQVQAVEQPIQEVLERVRADARYGERTALLLRAFSTGVKAKGSDNLAGAMLQDMGLVNIADGENTLMENLTMEAILEADPDYIFVVTMGEDDEKAMQALKENLTANPAWESLTAVREERFVVLDKSLFHYKPNALWAEGYDFLWNLMYDKEN